jgi:hypothetical protein
MIKTFKAPDLNSPRYRPSTFKVMRMELFRKFLTKYPEYKWKYNYDDFEKMIVIFNEALCKEAMENRDGIELPEGLGNIFLGTCWKPKKDNINFKESVIQGRVITNHNHETDGKLCKIFYTNYKDKYKFVNRNLWMFKPSETFQKLGSDNYLKDWKKYIHIDPNLKINKLYIKHKNRDYAKAQEKLLLEYYNEFDMN